jgi:Putative collagen-binding domain of a collagenase
MLFNGWSIENAKGSLNFQSPWKGHPFHKNNNINGIDGDPSHDNSGSEIHTLQIPAITALQEAYVRKVVDTLNDLDNVLFEISNESHQNSQAWQYHMIAYIKNYETSKPKEHPVGMTVEWPGGDNADLFASPADWISPNPGGGYMDDPPAADGSKVIIADTDHLWGIGGDRQWVWKSFLRGLHPIFMDGYDGKATGLGGAGFDTSNPTWVSLRRNMGYTLTYAHRIDLATMTPRGDLVSTGYCLARPAKSGAAYLAYLPTGGTITINLTATGENLIVEWFNPRTGVTRSGGTRKGGTRQSFTAPFRGDAVLYIYVSHDSAS